MKTKPTPLFRLKSNLTTIVERIGENSQRIVWSNYMEKYGKDSRWMVSRWVPTNAIALTTKQAEEVRLKIKQFDAARKNQRRTY